jgi:hypothetical protein
MIRIIVLAVALLVSSCSIFCGGGSIPEGEFVDNTDFDDTFGEYLPDEAGWFAGKTWLAIGDSISVRGLLASNYEEYVSK